MGTLWVVRAGAGGPAYWFPARPAANLFAARQCRWADTFIFPAAPPPGWHQGGLW